MTIIVFTIRLKGHKC